MLLEAGDTTASSMSIANVYDELLHLVESSGYTKDELDACLNCISPASIRQRATEVAVALITHCGISTETIMKDVACLPKIELDQLIDSREMIQQLGFTRLFEIVYYLRGLLTVVERRSGKGTDVSKLSDLLQGSSDGETSNNKFTHNSLSYLLKRSDLNTVTKTFHYLLQLGFSRNDITGVLPILAFTSADIKKSLNTGSETLLSHYRASRVNTVKLNLLVIYMDRKSQFTVIKSMKKVI